MRRDLSGIVTALINNIGTAQVYACSYNGDYVTIMKRLTFRVRKCLSALKSEWPNLQESEKQELEAIIYALDIMYSDDEQSSIKVDNSQKKL